ncbi:hypothetical protein [Sporosarcina aquimarina]|uniref:Uncharacterized protein n=1 Tax=Sporosarcina aquimarina TaxID=114975 RepID=A0ABU4G3A3_9BACL|nr:hypothetical protein [Sporosarcina aquimarina]MDW0110798.1 hypothetical protein [Sporosarcina aquimarina]
MDHARMLNQLQAAASDSLQTGTLTLGEIIIVSALLTEFATTAILFEEVRKFDEFNDNNTTPCQKIEYNEALADVLKGVCCIEDAVVKKIRAGIAYDAAQDTPDTPVNDGCCGRD